MQTKQTNVPLAASVSTRTICFSALNIIAQLYLQELGAPRFWIGMSTTLAWTAIMLFSRFWGAVSDLVPRRKGIIMVAAGGSTVMMLLLAASRSVPTVLAGRFLTAAFGAGLPPAAMALLSEKGDDANRGRRMSTFTTAEATGVLLGSILGGWLSTVLSFNAAFLAVAGVSGLSLVSATLVAGPARIEGGAKIRWASLLKGTLPSYRVVKNNGSLSKYGLGNLYLGMVLRKAGILGIYGLLMVFLQEERSLTPFISGSLSALNPAVQTLAMPLWGRAVDRFSRKRIFLTGYVFSLAGPLLMLFSNSIWGLGATFMVLGMGFAAFITGVTAFIGDVAPPEKEGELMGLLKVSQGIAGVVGPIIAGIVSSPSIGGYDAMFVVMTGLILVGLFITVLGTRESTREL